MLLQKRRVSDGPMLERHLLASDDQLVCPPTFGSGKIKLLQGQLPIRIWNRSMVTDVCCSRMTTWQTGPTLKVKIVHADIY